MLGKIPGVIPELTQFTVGNFPANSSLTRSLTLVNEMLTFSSCSQEVRKFLPRKTAGEKSQKVGELRPNLKPGQIFRKHFCEVRFSRQLP